MFLEGMHEKGLFKENDMIRVVLNTAENFDYPAHWHNAIEIVYCIENGVDIRIGSRYIHLDEKDILFICPGEIHGFKAQEAKGKRAFIQFDITSFGGLDEIISAFNPLVSTFKLSGAKHGTLHKKISEQIDGIIDAHNKKELSYALYLKARIYDIFFLLSTSADVDIMTDSLKSRKNKIYGLERLNKGLSFLENNYANNITLKDAAAAAGFSEYHFSRLFREVTGKKFLEYLNEFRIRKAETLLKKTDISISEAAYAVGFNNTTTFNRIFKAINGCTPTCYKARVRSNQAYHTELHHIK
ncbi:MAG: AraC family transcriptional regulator [Clostridiaceae bacterium]|nr:AraC family transcriptional regulator [Clostridiaceae bacterium]